MWLRAKRPRASGLNDRQSSESKNLTYIHVYSCGVRACKYCVSVRNLI